MQSICGTKAKLKCFWIYPKWTFIHRGISLFENFLHFNLRQICLFLLQIFEFLSKHIKMK